MSFFPISSAFAVDFVDRTGYIPEWVREMGQQQALMACSNVEYGTPDYDWCIEYSGYVLDQMNEQLEEQQQNPDEGFSIDKPTLKPQFNTNLFSDVKEVSRDTYVNKLYKFSIDPPANWSVIENAELIDGETAGIVAFHSDDLHPTYTSNFVINYEYFGAGFIGIYTDNEFLDQVVTGIAMYESGVRILEKQIESHADGYKIKIKFVHIVKLQEEQFATIQRESIVYLLDNGDMYILAFASTPEDFDKNVGAFHKSVDSFHVGNIQYAQAKSASESNKVSSKCGAGTVEKDGICVPMNRSESSGCLIATASYGTELAPQVQLLREIRDSSLYQTSSGTAFMTGFNEFYYTFSPTVSDWERQSPLFKEVVKLTITPMLSTLSILNYADIHSEQQMLGYGIGIILLNAGIYFGIPAVVIFAIRKKF